MSRILLLAAVCGALLATPAAAQKVKTKTKGAATAEVPTAARRLQPRFGGLTPEAARQFLGEKYMKNLEQSFASATEASQFFSRKGYEYLSEGQADTARYRFNLAWVLDPKNTDAYRGLGLLSTGTSIDEAIGLFEQGLSTAPDNVLLQTDLGASYLLRYEQTNKKKDLKTAQELLQKAVAADANNAYALQQMARVYYLQEDYPNAWAAVHKARMLDMTSVDFDLIANLKEKQPDPQGIFK